MFNLSRLTFIHLLIFSSLSATIASNKCDRNISQIKDLPMLFKKNANSQLYKEGIDLYDDYYKYLSSGGSFSEYTHPYFNKVLLHMKEKLLASTYRLGDFTGEHVRAVQNKMIQYIDELSGKKEINLLDIVKLMNVYSKQNEIASRFKEEDFSLLRDPAYVTLAGFERERSIALKSFSRGRLPFLKKVKDETSFSVQDYVNLSILPLYLIAIADDKKYVIHDDIKFDGSSGVLNHDLLHIRVGSKLWPDRGIENLKKSIMDTYRCTCQMMERSPAELKNKMAYMIFEVFHESDNPRLMNTKANMQIAMAENIARINKQVGFLEKVIATSKNLNGKSAALLPEYVHLSKIISEINDQCYSSEKNEEELEISYIPEEEKECETVNEDTLPFSPLIDFSHQAHLSLALALAPRVMQQFNKLSDDDKEDILSTALPTAALMAPLVFSRRLNSKIAKLFSMATLKNVSNLRKLALIPALIEQALFGSAAMADYPENIEYYLAPSGFSKINSGGIHRNAFINHPELVYYLLSVEKHLNYR